MFRPFSSFECTGGFRGRNSKTQKHSHWFLLRIHPKTRHFCIAVLIFIGFVLVGCSGTQKRTTTARSTLEQLLLSQSLQRSLNSATIPLHPGVSVGVEAVGLTSDKSFARDLVRGWLQEKGLHVGAEAPKYLIRIILHAFGTEQSEFFVGVPKIQSTVIPFALPELSFYKAIKQRGYTRLNIEVSDKKSGALIASSPVYEGDVYFNHTTLLLIFNHSSTDIVPPPL